MRHLKLAAGVAFLALFAAAAPAAMAHTTGAVTKFVTFAAAPPIGSTAVQADDMVDTAALLARFDVPGGGVFSRDSVAASPLISYRTAVLRDTAGQALSPATADSPFTPGEDVPIRAGPTMYMESGYGTVATSKKLRHFQRGHSKPG